MIEAHAPWDFEREVGATYWFEYHCWEDERSSDAPAWHRSHEQVIVLREQPNDAQPGSTFRDRVEDGEPRIFRACWADGFEWDVFEDELVLSPADFCRPVIQMAVQ